MAVDAEPIQLVADSQQAVPDTPHAPPAINAPPAPMPPQPSQQLTLLGSRQSQGAIPEAHAHHAPGIVFPRGPETAIPRKKWVCPQGKTLRDWVEEREKVLGIEAGYDSEEEAMEVDMFL